jgi:predicted MFS family arabinose efflux permease
VSYRTTLATPGLRPLLVVGLLAKLPGLGIPAVVVLHVVHGLDLGFGPAGIAAAAWTAGVGVGAPLQGWTLDRFGLRPLLAVVVVVQGAFWGFAHLLPYPALLVAAFAGGVAGVPAFTIVRLALAVSVPENVRHTAYVLDSITTDIAYMIGPSIGILVTAQASPTTAFLVMGGLLVASGAGYAVLNPPMRAAHEDKPTRSRWLTARLACVLAITAGSAIAILGIEVAAIGTLQRLGQLSWSWTFLVASGVCSIIGGFVYGALRRPPPPAVIAVCLGLAVLPIGLANHWAVLCLLVVPANLLVAPALSSTANAVSQLAPAGSRGVAMGAYASALMVGNVAGSPIAGAGFDAGGPVMAFLAVGATSAIVAAGAALVMRQADRPTVEVA